MAIIAGTNGADTLEGTPTNDLISGGNGADILTGGSGNDALFGGNGQDTLDGGTGNDILSGGNGQDTLDGGAGNDIVLGENGNDTATYVVADNSGDRDFYDGGSGTDVLRLVLTAEEWARADVQNDITQYLAILAGSTSGYGLYPSRREYQFTAFDLLVRNFERLDVVVGGQQATVLVSDPTGTATLDLSTSTTSQTIATVGSGDTNIATGSGNDTVIAGNGDNMIDVGAGSNTVTTGSGNDAIVAGDGGNTIDVGDGNNQVTTGSGADVIVAGAGDDVIVSGAGSDFVEIGAGNDFVDAGDGDDTVIAGEGGGDDIIDGSVGIDTVTYPSAVSGVTIDLRGVDRSATATFGGSTVGALLAGAGKASDLAVGLATGADIGTDILINIENATGGAGDDDITGNELSNTLSGAGGNDILTGGAGNDIIDGGAGDDTAHYAQGAGGASRYLVTFDDTALHVVTDFVAGSSDGNDTLAGIEFLSLGTDVFKLQTGTAGTDTITGVGDAWNLMFGGSGIDTLTGSDMAAVNVLVGDGGNDTLTGGNGTVYTEYWGGEDNDTITGGLLSFDMAAYAGSLDTFSITFDDVNVTVVDIDTSGTTFNEYRIADNPNGLNEGTDTLSGIEQLGFDYGRTFYGLQTGSAGDDTLFGTGGADLMFGGSGNDTLEGGAGADALDGGSGTDTASYAGSASGVSISLLSGSAADGDAQGDTLASIENLIGSAFADTFIGSTGSNVLIGGAGNDVINTWTGSDFVDAGDGDDDINSGDGVEGAGTDTIDGGDGFDYFHYNLHNSTTNVTVDAHTGSGTITSGAGLEATFSSIERLQIDLGSGNDTVVGTTGNDDLRGNGGNDVINTWTGSDMVIAGDGDDDINSGDGVEGAGTDTIDGGDGFDYFHYNLHNSTSNVTVDAHTGSGTITSGAGLEATFSSIERLQIDLGSGNDTVVGTSGDDHILGNGGNDSLTGGAGNDIIDGGAGDGDTAYYAQLAGGAGYRVTFDGTAVHVLDEFVVGPSDGDDTLTGVEFLSFNAGTQFFRLQTGSAGADTITGVDDTWNLIFGGDGNDTLNAGATFVNVLVGDAGDDTLTGGPNFTEHWGLTGDDTLIGTGGQNVAQYLGSLDKFAITFDDVHVTVTDLDAINPGDASDLDGGFDEGTDTLTGIDTLGFGWGNTIYGLRVGSASDDIVTGTDGADLLFGGSGNDIIDGGAGADLYIFQSGDGFDTILGFSGLGEGDVIDLAGVAGLTDFTQLKTLMTEIDGHVQLSLGGADMIEIQNTTIDSLRTEDFVI